MSRYQKITVFSLIFLLTISFISVNKVQANTDLAPQSQSAVLIDAKTGQILFEKNKQDRLAPASVTKVMTLLLIVEALEQGKIRLEEEVTASPEACRMGGSQIWLEPGEKMKVEDLIISIALQSANDSSYALAEHIAGSHENFVKMMNDKAKEFKMNNTNFVNCHGLDAEGHYTSAEDIAIMSRELAKHPQIFKWTSMYQYHLREGDSWLVNTNKLVRFYDGCDGFKTGSTNKAGFCLSATALKDGMRLIAVTMKAPTAKIRNAEITQMLNYGFANFTSQKIIDKGVVVEIIPVEKGMIDKLELATASDLQVLSTKSEKDQFTTRTEIPHKVTAPIEKNAVIGRLIAEKDGKEIAAVDLIATEKVEKTSIIRMFKSFLFSAIR